MKKKKLVPEMATLEQIGQALVDSFLELSPEERERMRKEMYEKATGKPYCPAEETPAEPHSMTTEQLGEALVRTVRQMSPREKAILRWHLRNEIGRHPEEPSRVQ